MPFRSFSRSADGSALGRLLGDAILDHLITGARAANGLAQLEILADGHLFVAGEEHVARLSTAPPAELPGPFAFPVSFSFDPQTAFRLYGVTSSGTPGPMVEQMVTLRTYLPLAAAGLAFTTACSSVLAFSSSLSLVKLTLPDRNVNHAGLVDAKLDLTGLDFLHRVAPRPRSRCRSSDSASARADRALCRAVRPTASCPAWR